MEPDPHESEPLVESGEAEGGEETLGEGAVSVTVRCGDGGAWRVEEADATMVDGRSETVFGLALLCG